MRVQRTRALVVARVRSRPWSTRRSPLTRRPLGRKNLEARLRRLVAALFGSPVLIAAVGSLLVGFGLSVLGVLGFGAPRPSSLILSGLLLAGFSLALIIPRLLDLPIEPPPSPPDDGHRLPPAQEAALSVDGAERQSVMAVGTS